MRARNERKSKHAYNVAVIDSMKAKKVVAKVQDLKQREILDNSMEMSLAEEAHKYEREALEKILKHEIEIGKAQAYRNVRIQKIIEEGKQMEVLSNDKQRAALSRQVAPSTKDTHSRTDC